MIDGDIKPNNPLSPYFPSEVPDVPGSGRKWVAVLLSLLLILGTAYGVLSMIFPP